MRKPLLLATALLFVFAEVTSGQSSSDSMDPIRNGLSLWARLLERMSQERPPSDDELHFRAPPPSDLPPLAFTLPPLFRQTRTLPATTAQPPRDALAAWARSATGERQMTNVVTPIIDGIGPLILPLFGIPAPYQQPGLGGAHAHQMPSMFPLFGMPSSMPAQRPLPAYGGANSDFAQRLSNPLPISSPSAPKRPYPPDSRQRLPPSPPGTPPSQLQGRPLPPPEAPRTATRTGFRQRKRGQSRSRSSSRAPPTLIRLTGKAHYWPTLPRIAAASKTHKTGPSLSAKSGDEYFAYPKFPHRRFMPNPSEYRKLSHQTQPPAAVDQPSPRGGGEVQHPPLQVDYVSAENEQRTNPYAPRPGQSPLEAAVAAPSGNIFERLLGMSPNRWTSPPEPMAPPPTPPPPQPQQPPQPPPQPPSSQAVPGSDDSGYDLGRNQVQSRFAADSGLFLGPTSAPPFAAAENPQSISDGFGLEPAPAPPSSPSSSASADSGDSGLNLGRKPNSDPNDSGFAKAPDNSAPASSPDSGLGPGFAPPDSGSGFGSGSGPSLGPPFDGGGGSGSFGGGSFGSGRRPDSSYEEVVKSTGRRRLR